MAESNYPRIKPSGGQTISVTSTSAKATNAAPMGVTGFSIKCDQECYVRTGLTDDAATTSDYHIEADTVLFLGINPDEYVHAIRDSADGTARIHWLLK